MMSGYDQTPPDELTLKARQKFLPMASFIDRLHQLIKKRKTPALIGLDPRWEQIPESIRHQADDSQTNPNAVRARAYRIFCYGIIDVVAPLVAVVKPQAAFFEQLGPAGCQALADVIHYARTKGLLVICDAKRGDIGSTAEAYASAYLAGSDVTSAPWGADALTVNPYLGADTLEPFIKVAQERNAGIYVLVRTSNPGAGTFQDKQTDGTKLFETVADTVEQWNAEIGENYGSIGAVIGATYPEELQQLRNRMPHTPFLIPGYGAQGGGAADVSSAFDPNGLGAVINSSRGINFAYQREPYSSQFGPEQWQEAVEAATHDMIKNLADETPAGQL